MVLIEDAALQRLVAIFQGLETRLEAHGLDTSVQNRLVAGERRSEPGNGL
jgi:hypothetical protein